MLPVLLFNVLSGLVIDKATDLAKEHVEDMIESILPEEAKAELDELVKEDPAHPFETAKEALVAAAAGKLPIMNTDGTLKSIELTFTVKFDPNTQEISIDQE